MSEIYRKNIESLKKRNLSMAQFIDQVDDAQYSLDFSKENPFLKINFPGKGVVCFHDKGDVDQYCKEKIPQLDTPRPLFLLIGMGLGYLFFNLQRRYPEALILIVEHDAKVFKKALEVFDFSSHFESSHIEFLVGLKPERLLSLFAKFFMRNDHFLSLPLMELVQDPKIIKYSQTYYEKVSQVFKRANNYYWEVCVGNQYSDSLDGAKNVFANLKKMDRMISVEPYKGLFKGLPGIVVSSGPSLTSKLDFLKEVQNKVPIICSDSSLKTLLRNGIQPFGVACIERCKQLPEVFRDIEIPKDVLLFMVPQVMPAIVNEFPGQMGLLFRDVFPFLMMPDFLPKRNLGASCAHVSLLMLCLLGCSDIALIGQDLAYDRVSGKTHVEGVPEYATVADSKLERRLATDNQGGQIETQIYWMMFRDIFEQIIQDLPGLHLMNVIEPENGLKITGAERMDLGFFKEKYINGLSDSFEKVSFSKGRDYLQNKIPKFKREWNQVVEFMTKEFEKLKLEMSAFHKAQTSEEYFEMKQGMKAQIDEKAYQIFDSMFLSVNRRFEASAFSLWSSTEFPKHCKDYVHRAHKAIDEFLDIMSEAHLE